MMEGESIETRVVRLEEYRQNVKDQLGRLVSQMESEQRVYGGHGKRLDLMEKLFEKMQRDIEVYDKILRNGGVGLSIRMDRIEQRDQGSKNRIGLWLSIAAVIVSVLNFIISNYAGHH